MKVAENAGYHFTSHGGMDDLVTFALLLMFMWSFHTKETFYLQCVLKTLNHFKSCHSRRLMLVWPCRPLIARLVSEAMRWS
jgi:hypothetical protein